MSIKGSKKVEHLETLINAIKHDENNSGYRVEVNFGNGKLYEDNTESYGVDIYVLSNYKNYNEQGKKSILKAFIIMNSNTAYLVKL